MEEVVGNKLDEKNKNPLFRDMFPLDKFSHVSMQTKHIRILHVTLIRNAIIVIIKITCGLMCRRYVPTQGAHFCYVMVLTDFTVGSLVSFTTDTCVSGITVVALAAVMARVTAARPDICRTAIGGFFKQKRTWQVAALFVNVYLWHSSN